MSLFGKSFKRELGKNTGKWVSNVVFGDRHSTPYRRVDSNNNKESKQSNAELKYKLQQEKLNTEESLRLKEQLNILDSEITKKIDSLAKLRIPNDKEELLHILSELSAQVESNYWQEEGNNEEARIRNRYSNALLDKYKQCVLRLASIDSNNPQLDYFENTIVNFRRKKFWKNVLWFILPSLLFIFLLFSRKSSEVLFGLFGITVLLIVFYISFPKKKKRNKTLAIQHLTQEQIQRKKNVHDIIEDSIDAIEENANNAINTSNNESDFIENKLNEIWSSNYIQTLPSLIKDRGFCYSINNNQKDILITGINPSFRINHDINGSFGYDIQTVFQNPKYDIYWSPIKKMIYDVDIDFRSKTAYLDIFYFREKEQKFLKREILSSQNGLPFIIDQIKLTQKTVEDIIKPKVIIIKNTESSAYWGKLANKGYIWMGYDLKFIENTSAGELFRIIGLLDSPNRVADEIKTTNLIGTLVLFTQHISQYTKTENRPTANQIKELLLKY